ncbi:hypothetical protein HELRODRAFT_107172 [Helobdella robusta]|uniref:O-phosphoseryl-tRNA(Sec) selenium transferase n=1 Tax=Helobdella robusta TaxID=6412 RepID=T1EE84_HELRO|nr:hypothetical protein HELRODRAFT_107172 [Helobdella robusta]ESN99143.1 hypothetical protein HELRODRAFT_107172 [Helobdella robusta]
MNERLLESGRLGDLLPASYVNQAVESRRSYENKLALLLEKKKWPEEGWSEQWIEMFLSEISMMDTNNFTKNSQVGEREGRVLSSIVARRHFRLIHGIGKSGYLTEVQPKAAGSSLLMKLANALATDALRQFGFTSISSAIIIPMATGMTLTFCMMTLKKMRGPSARWVLWPRIDQKSCIKSVLAAGLQLCVIENELENEEIRTNMKKLTEQVDVLGAENILCVMTTTSCFAPRAPDRLEEVAALCKERNIPHLVNNAYGLQSSKLTHLIQQAQRVGRVDVIVQSTDKNFLVPVGGSVIASYEDDVIRRISSMYPGRASASSHLDLLITFLQVGLSQFKNLLRERKEMFEYLKSKLNSCAAQHNERVLNSPNNKISIAMSLSNFNHESVTYIGSMLFTRHVSGVRVIARHTESKVEDHSFIGFGSSHDNYPSSYLTAAAALGITKADVDLFIERLHSVLTKAGKNSKLLNRAKDGDTDQIADANVEELNIRNDGGDDDADQGVKKML